MAGPDATPVGYLPYDLPLRLSGALRRAARMARPRLRRQLVPGGGLLGRRRRPGVRLAGRLGDALAWRRLRSAPAIPKSAAARREVGRPVHPSGARPARQAEPGRALGAERREGLAAVAPVETPRAKRDGGSVPGGAAAGLLVWTRLRRRGRPAAVGTEPVPEALVAARHARRGPMAGMAAAEGTRWPGVRPVAPALTPARFGAGRPLMGAPPRARAPETSRGAGVPAAAPGFRRDPELTERLPASGAFGRGPAASPPEAIGPARVRRAGDSIEAGPGVTAEIAVAGSPLAWRKPAPPAAWPALERLVERTVAREMGAERGRPASGPGPAGAPEGNGAPAGARPAAGVVTEEMVVQLVSRLRALAREERFRSGRRR